MWKTDAQHYTMRQLRLGRSYRVTSTLEQSIRTTGEEDKQVCDSPLCEAGAHLRAQCQGRPA